MSKDDLDWDNPSTGIFTDYFGTQQFWYRGLATQQSWPTKLRLIRFGVSFAFCLLSLLDKNAGGNDGGGLDRLADREQGTGTTGEGGLNKRSHGKLA